MRLLLLDWYTKLTIYSDAVGVLYIYKIELHDLYMTVLYIYLNIFGNAMKCKPIKPSTPLSPSQLELDR